MFFVVLVVGVFLLLLKNRLEFSSEILSAFFAVLEFSSEILSAFVLSVLFWCLCHRLRDVAVGSLPARMERSLV